MKAALATFAEARVAGYELSPEHLATARVDLADTRAELHQGDFFETDWSAVMRALPEPILALGNPPWVTSSTLGSLGSENLPEKVNFKRHRGLDAITGKANFDISEWMLTELIGALRGRAFTVAMLCKSSVARRLLETAGASRWPLDGATWRIDAREHFDAAVHAVLLTVSSREDAPSAPRWPVYDGLDAEAPSRCMGVVGGALYSDLDAFTASRDLAGRSEIEWRSGVKHDCAAVMELRRDGEVYVNGLGERVELEGERVFPLRKGSDVANGREARGRYVIVTQRALGEDTSTLRATAPRTWAYLDAHRPRLAARRSAIYREQHPFAMFGVGGYSFAPYKVAICGLYKRLRFSVVAPEDGRPAMLDDTSYFLPCPDGPTAHRIAEALNGERAQAFLRARVFWDAKRPVNKSLLQSLSLEALLRGDAAQAAPR